MTTPAVIIGIARFGPYEVDVRSGELRKLGTRIKLGEQTLRIVVLVMDRPGELVTREELCAGRWSDDTLRILITASTPRCSALRESLSDTAEKAPWIETVRRRGDRFVGSPVDQAKRTNSRSYSQRADGRSTDRECPPEAGILARTSGQHSHRSSHFR